MCVVQVRPLVGNAKIEKLNLPSLVADAAGHVKGLPFKALTAAMLLEMGQPDLEAFLTQVCRSANYFEFPYETISVSS